MGSTINPFKNIVWFDDDMQGQDEMNANILECKGILQCLWNTRIVTLYTDVGTHVDEGICYSANSDLVFGVNGPLGDTHVVVHISKSL